MRHVLAITLFTALTAPVASAAVAVCPIAPDGPVANAIPPGCGEPGGGGGGGGGAPACPTTIPRPANSTVCACWTAGHDTSQRCASGISQDTCNTLISTAVGLGLLTSDAVDWLHANGFCPIVLPTGSIVDFCPVGCFAADTPILTAMNDDGGAVYAAASQVAPKTALVGLSDESELDATDLVSRKVNRVVYGPEAPALFVFGLKTGATLRVTSHHPMVLDTGIIVEAADVQPGSAFIGADGGSVAVLSITREPATADVFNFETNGDSQLSHVIVAQNVLVGDLKLQNELGAEQSAIELRR